MKPNPETITLYYNGWNIFPHRGNWCVVMCDTPVDDYLTMGSLQDAYNYIDKRNGEWELEKGLYDYRV